MAKMSERDLLKRDAKRDIGEELLRAVREMKAGKAARVRRVPVSAITEARSRVGMSQTQFAEVLGVSTRTLQEWEQGRRQPSGAARALLAIAAKRPEVLREVLAG
jgi:putative transcriptional regulator